MTLAELLESLKLGDGVADKIVKAMAEQKMYITGTEGIDGQFSDLKAKYDSLDKTNSEAQALIKRLKKTGEDPEETKKRIEEYEKRITELEQESRARQLEGEIKVALLSAKAKPDDIDYLIFQLRKTEADLAIGENGKVRGLEEAVKTLKTAHPGNFEGDGAGTGPKPLPNPLPKTDPPKETEPKNLAEAIKMQYEAKTEQT